MLLATCTAKHGLKKFMNESNLIHCDVYNISINDHSVHSFAYWRGQVVGSVGGVDQACCCRARPRYGYPPTVYFVEFTIFAPDIQIWMMFPVPRTCYLSI